MGLGEIEAKIDVNHFDHDEVDMTETRLGHFVLRDIIGEGGMGRVYKGATLAWNFWSPSRFCPKANSAKLGGRCSPHQIL